MPWNVDELNFQGTIGSYNGVSVKNWNQLHNSQNVTKEGEVGRLSKQSSWLLEILSAGDKNIENIIVSKNIFLCVWEGMTLWYPCACSLDGWMCRGLKLT